MKRRYLAGMLLLLFVFGMTSIVPAQEKIPSGEVFDLGDVLIMEKGDETSPITTTEIIGIERIHELGAQTASDVLEFIPGLDIQSGKKGQAGLTVRGFQQEEVRVLIDGVPAHVAYDGSLDLGQIPVDSIAKIKVIKGASSVLYGPNTMGGVVNIITKKGSEKPYTSVTTSFGPNNTQNYVANHGASVGKFNYWLTASHRTSDGFDLSDNFDPNNSVTGIGTEYNEDGGIRDLSYYTYNTLSAKFGFEYDTNSKLYLSIDYHDNEKGCPTEEIRNNMPRYWEFTDYRQWHVNLVGEHDITDIWSMKARLFYVDHYDNLKDVSWDANHTSGMFWWDESSYDDYSVGGEVQSYLDFGDKSLVRLGISYIKDNHVQQDYNIGTGYDPEEEYESDTYSFGIEDEIRLGKWTLNGGFSYDVNDPISADGGVSRDKEETWNPQIGASFDATKELNVYASVSKKTKFPSMKELYSDLAGGDSSLKPQKTIAYELGIRKQFGKNVRASVAAFYNDVEDRIVRNSNREMENVGESEIKGFETQLNVETPWNLDFGLGYTYLTGKEKENAASQETDVEYLPEHKLTLDSRYSFEFGLSAFLQVIYTGEQVEYDGSDKRVINDFVLLNTKLNQKISVFDKVGTDLFFEVKNIFDEDYEEGHGPTPGRSFLVGMTLSF